MTVTIIRLKVESCIVPFVFFFPFLAANSLFSGTQRVDNEKERTNVNIEHNLIVLNLNNHC